VDTLRPRTRAGSSPLKGSRNPGPGLVRRAGVVGWWHTIAELTGPGPYYVFARVINGGEKGPGLGKAGGTQDTEARQNDRKDFGSRKENAKIKNGS